jgi:hypothetical protein
MTRSSPKPGRKWASLGLISAGLGTFLSALRRLVPRSQAISTPSGQISSNFGPFLVTEVMPSSIILLKIG